jgi:hypothetical protein
LEKEATATAQANAMDAQTSASARYGVPPQPKKSRKLKAPHNNIPGALSTHSNINKGGRGGRDTGGGGGGRTRVAKKLMLDVFHIVLVHYHIFTSFYFIYITLFITMVTIK